MKKILYLITIICLLILLLSSYSIAQGKKVYGKDIIETEEGITEYKENRIAVIIGINEYLNIKGLKFASSDAELVKDILETQGAFTVQLLSDNSNIKPTKHNILKTLNNIRKMAESMSTLKTFVFYFSGHGFNTGGRNYIAPMDVDPNDIKNSGIDIRDIFDIIKIIQKNAKVMMFIDACRNDPISKSTGTSWGDETSRGAKVLYSTSEGDYSYELPELEHGVYTLHLSNALKGLADIAPYGNSDGHVSFQEASEYVTSKMLDFSTNNPYDISQTPRVEMMDVLGDFYLTKVDETEVKIVTDIVSVATILEEEEYYSKEYYSMMKPIYEQLKKYIDEQNMSKAIDSCDTILRIISQYEKDIDLSNDKGSIKSLKEKMKQVIKSNRLFEEGDAFLSEKKFEEALKKYSGALTIVLENNLEQFIKSKPIAEKLAKSDYQKISKNLSIVAMRLLRRAIMPKVKMNTKQH